MRELPVFRKSGHIYSTSVGVIQTHPNQNLLGSGAMNGRLWPPCVMVFMCPNSLIILDKETHKCFEQVLLYKLGLLA